MSPCFPVPRPFCISNCAFPPKDRRSPFPQTQVSPKPLRPRASSIACKFRKRPEPRAPKGSPWSPALFLAPAAPPPPAAPPGPPTLSRAPPPPPDSPTLGGEVKARKKVGDHGGTFGAARL